VKKIPKQVLSCELRPNMVVLCNLLFGKRIKEEPIAVGFKIEMNIKLYNGVGRSLTWLQDYFYAIQFVGGSPISQSAILS
jgi:hypothetical protein